MPPKKETPPLLPFYDISPTHPRWEIALDESGRGPMFGRVYAAAVVLPRDPALFDTTLMKDSKKIHSKKKMKELAEYIRAHAEYTSVHFQEADTIDRVNILQADMMCMHDCIREILSKTAQSCIEGNTPSIKDVSLIIDGNYFKPYSVLDESTESMYMIPHTTIEQGDGKYASIAAASILAKYERDKYIEELCEEYPELKTRYSLHTNMGYGTAAHLKGIQEYGVTQWHRKSFGKCK
uniref:ribonuclease H n=1 Tax=viral metagenome TaxID=1070528 RepID=A0A6C0HTF8_9ZZZZ